MATTSALRRWTYDVFVSFRGEDIRKTFIDHLFSDFERKKIISYRDDIHLPRGEEISSQLFSAIENSRFLIVIFSKNYASSSWCLRELVKILECMQMVNYNYQVQIVFYDVKPSVVRNQTGSYAEAFTQHESLKKKEVLKWKEALTMAADLSGWDLQDMANGYESKFINIISNDILLKLCDSPLDVGENLVGVGTRVQKMNLLRFVDSTKVHMIGICGFGGTGKTTLAKVIYNLMHVHFGACSFCEDVQGVAKQHGLLQVLVQLIDNIITTRDLTITGVAQGTRVLKRGLAAKRVLIVLDNIDDPGQLEALAGSSSWFFPGSLIVFTSRDKQLLNAHEVDKIVDIDFLNDDEALKLFSLYAFRKESPVEDFKELADQVVQYVQGHPLALKVLGCFLFRKTLSEWKSELDKLQVYPSAEILQVLLLSYKGLDSVQQKVFLDIASSLKGENRDLAADVLNSCNCFADSTIRVLVDKSLVTISSTKLLQMHDLIQRMACEIERNESESKRSGERSRLWIPDEVCDVLNKDKVTDAVEVLVLLHDIFCQKVQMDGKAFARMNNLRILKICNLELVGVVQRFDLKQANTPKVDISGSLDFLSNELRLLYWHEYPFKFLPSSFYPENIVAIDMSYSNLKSLWTTPKHFKNLKVMKLRHCRNLAKAPDFTEIKNLEELTLDGCIKLVRVHPSVWSLKRLIVLNLRNCRSLRNFPNKIETESLQILNISGCSKVDKLPDAIGTIKALVELCIDGTAIKQIPSFISGMSNLQVLSIAGCRETQSKWRTSIFHPTCFMKRHHLPRLVFPSCTDLRLLRVLDASHCNISEISPNSISGLSCLDSLDLSGNNFTSLPASLCHLPRLSILLVAGCKNLEVLPELPRSIFVFDASDCTSLRELQNQQLDWGHALDLTNCQKLAEHYTVESLVSIMTPLTSNYLWQNSRILLQGTRIPRWFTYQSGSNCATAKVPTRWCNWRYATCVVFRVNNLSSTAELTFRVIEIDGETINKSFSVSLAHFIRNAVSYHMWLYYSKLIPRFKDARTSITFKFTSSDNVEVKGCGVRLVSDDELPEESS